MWEPASSGFVYELSPVDWWTGWVTPEQAADERLDDDRLPGEGLDTRERLLAEINRIVDNALGEFRKRSLWEGDIVTGPLIAGLPPADGNADGDIMVGIKQSNNGTVFIWSPYPLTWISDYEK